MTIWEYIDKFNILIACITGSVVLIGLLWVYWRRIIAWKRNLRSNLILVVDFSYVREDQPWKHGWKTTSTKSPDVQWKPYIDGSGDTCLDLITIGRNCIDYYLTGSLTRCKRISFLAMINESSKVRAQIECSKGIATEEIWITAGPYRRHKSLQGEGKNEWIVPTKSIRKGEFSDISLSLDVALKSLPGYEKSTLLSVKRVRLSGSLIIKQINIYN